MTTTWKNSKALRAEPDEVQMSKAIESYLTASAMHAFGNTFSKKLLYHKR